MAQILDIRKAFEARRHSGRAKRERRELEAAIGLMKSSLAEIVERLGEAPFPEQYELAERIGKLAETIRYALRMLEGLPGADEAGGTH